MKWSIKTIRLRGVWILVPVFLVLARPQPETMVAGAMLAAAGAVVRAWASGTIRKNVVLTTTGPYAYTRNPLYVGSFLVGLGVTIASGSPWLVGLFLGFFVIIYGKTMRLEAEGLEARFGDRFREYAAAVPLFVPRLRPYRSMDAAQTQFMVRRYFTHREWELLLGLALGFLALVVKMRWF
jgi:protein-S-isoprenylcysteine O-methyltransferase Ste14